MNGCLWILTTPRERPAVFEARFSRCRALLYFLACRALGSPEQADQAVRNCFLKASSNPPRFKNEGAFASWLFRILIDETLLLLRQKKNTSTISPKQVFSAGR